MLTASNRALLKRILNTMGASQSTANQDRGQIPLASGDNILFRPSPHRADLAILIPAEGNTATLILKAALEDTLTLHPRIPTIIAISETAYIINASAETAIVIRWFNNLPEG